MDELERLLKWFDDRCDEDTVIPMTLGQARGIVRKYIVLRQTLRRITSLDDKNVPKFAKDIAAEGLRLGA